MIPKKDWEKNKSKAFYEPEELAKDGFIHFSFKNQLVGVANAVYKEFNELVVLEVDVDRLSYPETLSVEDLYGYNETYPHLYSRLNTSAIISEFLMKNTQQGYILTN